MADEREVCSVDKYCVFHAITADVIQIGRHFGRMAAEKSVFD